jgi:uncharacterized membrane protein
MINTVEDYLAQLRKELAGCDPAIIRDAESDAEEYLRNALEKEHLAKPNMTDADTLPGIIEKYGLPEEVAGSYRDLEKRTTPYKTPNEQINHQTSLAGFFGIVTDPRAWGALFYMFVSLGTGIAYFTWAVTGLSLSFGLLILIIGLPFAALFLLSIRGLSILEGRVVEALLGVRMPRRAPFQQKKMGLWARFKTLFSDRYTWFSLLYMIVQLGLGITYFTVFTVLMAISLGLIFEPLFQPIFHHAVVTFGNNPPFFYDGGWMVLGVLIGVALFFVTMHLARWTGKLHGAWAKTMLVRL